jgi:hypothetical protein
MFKQRPAFFNGKLRHFHCRNMRGKNAGVYQIIKGRRDHDNFATTEMQKRLQEQSHIFRVSGIDVIQDKQPVHLAQFTWPSKEATENLSSKAESLKLFTD